MRYADLGHGDFGIRNTKLYEAYYGWLDKFTKQADEMLEREGKGPTVAMPLSLNYANEDSTMSWFQQALNQIVMRPMREVIVIPSQSTQAFETVTNMPEDDDFPFGGGEDEDEVDDEAGQPVAVPLPDLPDGDCDFTTYMSKYQQLTNLISTREQRRDVHKMFDNMISSLMAANRKPNSAARAQGSGFASIPETERRRKDKRRRPAMEGPYKSKSK